MISRDVTFNKSTFGFSPTLPQEILEDTALDFESMNIGDGPHITQFKQAGKRKNRSNNQEQASQRILPARRGARLEEASAPEDFESHQAKRRSRIRGNLNEEQKDDNENDHDATLKCFGE